MIRENLNIFYLKLTTIAPLHIGTGEAYAPTNFVIDNGKLFEFDEVLFYQSLNPSDKKEFGQKLNNWMGIIDFYHSKVTEAKAVASLSVRFQKRLKIPIKNYETMMALKRKISFK